MFHRLGSVDSGITADQLDCYEIVCLDGTQWDRIFLDMYHPRRSNLAPEGYRLQPFDKKVGFDMFFGFGCRFMVDDFPHGLPDAVIHEQGQKSGEIIAKPVTECLQKYKFIRPDFPDDYPGMLHKKVIGPFEMIYIERSGTAEEDDS